MFAGTPSAFARDRGTRAAIPDRPYSDVENVVDLHDHLGIERAALVGSSYGGKVILDVAALRPDAVSARVPLCSGMPGHEPGPALRSLAERENALLGAGDIAGP